jgi:hypothetical protein
MDKSAITQLILQSGKVGRSYCERKYGSERKISSTDIGTIVTDFLVRISEIF